MYYDLSWLLHHAAGSEKSAFHVSFPYNRAHTYKYAECGATCAPDACRFLFTLYCGDLLNDALAMFERGTSTCFLRLLSLSSREDLQGEEVWIFEDVQYAYIIHREHQVHIPWSFSFRPPFDDLLFAC